MKYWSLKSGRVIVVLEPAKPDVPEVQNLINAMRSPVVAMADFILVRQSSGENRFKFVKCRTVRTREDVEAYSPLFAALGKACRRVTYEVEAPGDPSKDGPGLYITFPSETDLMYFRMLG